MGSVVVGASVVVVVELVRLVPGLRRDATRKGRRVTVPEEDADGVVDDAVTKCIV